MELILKNVNPKDVSLLSDIAKRLGIKVEKKADSDVYDPAFVAKIEKSLQQAADGKVVKIDLDDIWKQFILSKLRRILIIGRNWEILPA